MTVSVTYDKFDDRTSYGTSLHLIDNHSGIQGTYWAIFSFSIDPTIQQGHLAIVRVGDGWLWSDETRVVVMADDTRIETDKARRVNVSTFFPSGSHNDSLDGLRDAIEIDLTQEQCLAMANAKKPIEGKAGSFQFSFGKGFMKDISEAVSANASK